MHEDVVVIIPSRIGSTRLSEKPLKSIGPLSMIEHILSQVKKTGIQNIYVATDSEAIAEKVRASKIEVIFTNSSCPSGTDRVYEAFRLIPNNKNINYIVNVQGDMPFVQPESILKVIEELKNSNYDIMTPVVKVDIREAEGDSTVKVVIDNRNQALYFSRSLIPSEALEFLYHVGIYAFRKAALAKFIDLPVSFLEKYERLEQLRALENGMSIGVCHVNNIPISVDTEEDLNKAKEFYDLLYVKNAS